MHEEKLLNTKNTQNSKPSAKEKSAAGSQSENEVHQATGGTIIKNIIDSNMLILARGALSLLAKGICSSSFGFRVFWSICSLLPLLLWLQNFCCICLYVFLGFWFCITSMLAA